MCKLSSDHQKRVGTVVKHLPTQNSKADIVC